MKDIETRWHDIADPRDLAQQACSRILAAAGEAIAEHGVFDIVLAGGSTPRRTYELLRAAPANWMHWRIWFGDERCLPADHADRNSVMARTAWLDHVPIPPASIHAIPAELGAREGAYAYAAPLADIDMFDLVLLGLGEDAHTASLFPGRDWGQSPHAADTLAVFNAPKPPPERVSLSAARLSLTRRVLFLVEGEGKRDAVNRWRAGANIPARAVAPAAGVDVLIDAALLAAAP